MAPSQFHSLFNLLAILLIIACTVSTHSVAAQADDISELVRLINELRASYGLDPYIVDPGLMALAQEHSEYQASIQTSTHQHSDGRTPPQIGVVENVAGGDIGFLEPYAAVYEIWADPVHQRAMIGFSVGSMGVGIADDETTVYYTLEVRPANKSTSEFSASRTASAPLTPIPLATLVVSTPHPDGSIVHIVGYGQTLWAIALAYGVRIDQIRAWNNIATDSNDIYAGQYLLVRPANLVTASPTFLTEPGTQQPLGIMVSTGMDTVERTMTPLPPGNTPTVTELALLSRPTGDEVQDDTQASSKVLPAGSGLLTPFLAGGSILIGCALLLFLIINKKPS